MSFICQRSGLKKEGESYCLNNDCSFPFCEQGRIEPNWVCFDCARKRGAVVPEGHLCTVNINICGICKLEKEVTEPRDFGRTRQLLTITIE